ncbi:MAG: efflux RND transporter permease subunit, partial [Planctomycetes bacterium]|nr:efflux RND transporter permease subunit [Planctomycetota bacterium]
MPELPPTNHWLSAVIDRPVTVGMLTIAAVVFGVVSFTKLPIELLPDISYPSLTIQTELPDAAPEEVEQLIADRIEPVVGVVSGLQRYHSVSRAGVSEITLEFTWNTDMTVAALDVREKLDLVDLPDGARTPVVFRFDPSLDPVIRLALRGEVPTRDLRRLAEGFVKQRLETVTGVAAAKVVGGADEEVRIELDEGRITALGMTIDEVAARIAAENINRSGGELRDAETAYILRTVNEYGSLEDIEATIIRDAPEGGEVRLRDIGRARLGYRDEEVRVRVRGVPAVELHIYKEGDANSVAVARAVRERIGEASRDRRMQGVEAEILFDQARYIEESVQNVQSTALLGALLAAIVLFLFLRDLLSTLIIALSIPISVTVTFLCMRAADVSINVMSLGGLALGIGMLVDNSVVVLEAVHRRRDLGTSYRDAVLVGTGEVFGGVVASTLTTVSVFLPLIFVEGVAGQVFRDQALVVTFS